MPMIDVYAAAGTFSDKRSLAQELAKALMRSQQLPPIALFSTNTVGHQRARVHHRRDRRASLDRDDRELTRGRQRLPPGH